MAVVLHDRWVLIWQIGRQELSKMLHDVKKSLGLHVFIDFTEGMELFYKLVVKLYSNYKWTIIELSTKFEL